MNVWKKSWAVLLYAGRARQRRAPTGAVRRPLWHRHLLAIGFFVCCGALVFLPGCQTLRQVANLRQVDFSIDDVERASLAGVDLDRVRSADDLRASDLLRLTRAVTGGEAPLAFTLVLGADNPAANSTDARLVQMDWTLFLDDRETVSGTFDQNVLIPAGERSTVPIPIRLDLVQFFDRGAQDLVELALAVTGQGGEKNIRLRARPTIDTPLGPIQYPQAITILSRDVGTSR